MWSFCHAVITENCVPLENTNVKSFVRSSSFSHTNEPCLRCLARFACLYISDSRRPAGRDRRSAPPDRRAPTQLTASSVPQAGRPTALDSVVALVARLAALGVHREARHSYSLASQGVRSILDLEVAPSSWKTGSGCRDSRPDPTHKPSQRLVVPPFEHQPEETLSTSSRCPPVRVAGRQRYRKPKELPDRHRAGVAQFLTPAETRLRLPDDHSTGPKLLDPEMWNLQTRELRDE